MAAGDPISAVKITKEKMRLFPLILGTWNVHKLVDKAGIGKPQRTVLIGSELASYNMKIAALNEIQLRREGGLFEWDTGYTFGVEKKSEECHEAGISFAVKMEFLGKPAGLPKGRYNWIMNMKPPTFAWEKVYYHCQCPCSNHDQSKRREGQIL